MGYGRFVAMIATSTVVMFGLMYLNTYSIDHIEFSQTRMWMAIYMGAVMAVIMLAFMLGMYSDRRKNIAIVLGAGLAFGMSLWLVRSQQTVEDLAWMRAMIPHHSIAIMTSEVPTYRTRGCARWPMPSSRRSETRSPRCSAISPTSRRMATPPPARRGPRRHRLPDRDLCRPGYWTLVRFAGGRDVI